MIIYSFISSKSIIYLLYSLILILIIISAALSIEGAAQGSLVVRCTMYYGGAKTTNTQQKDFLSTLLPSCYDNIIRRHDRILRS